MKNALISSIVIFFTFCSAQEKTVHQEKYTVSLEIKKCSDQISIKNSKNQFLLIWNGEDCENTLRSYVQNVDLKNDTITINIWMENIDELSLKIVANTETPYIQQLRKKTHYFDKNIECRYHLNHKLSGETELSKIVYEWFDDAQCD